MKNFKSFVAEEKPNIKRKAKGEQDFVDAHEVEITDPTDQGNNSAKVTTKANSGKHKNDRADNKQEFGEAVKKTYQVSGKSLAAKMRQNPLLKSFADKFENKPIVTPQMVDKMLPDYVSGAEITKLFKESAEQIDELSNKLLNRYAHKAGQSHAKLSDKRDELQWQHDNMKGVDKDKHKKRIADIDRKLKNRERGMDSADHDRLHRQEEVDLEEETQTYMVKFEKNGKVSLKNYEAKSDLDARSKAKVDAKRMGMTVASVRLKEEVEELDELSKETLKSYVQGAKQDVAQRKKAFKSSSMLPPQASRKQYNRLRGMHIATNKMGEEVEELDEISKKTLGSYISKAGIDMANRSADHAEKLTNIMRDYDHEVIAGKFKYEPTKDAETKMQKKRVKIKPQIDKAVKRMYGIDKAIKRLTKEEQELDEKQLTEFDLHEGYEKKVLDYLDRKGIDAEFVSGKLQVNKRDVAKAKAALSKASGFDASDLEVVAEAAYTNPGLERLAAAKKRNQPSHTNPGLEALAKKKKSLRQMKQEMAEADFSKKETKMAHTIGKEFEKKGVGDKAQGGPYAVASAMVRDKPEAAKKAYKTIQSKMKEEADAELLFNLYNDLNEENQEMFMSQLEEDADSLLQFAKNFLADE